MGGTTRVTHFLAKHFRPEPHLTNCQKIGTQQGPVHFGSHQWQVRQLKAIEKYAEDSSGRKKTNIHCFSLLKSGKKETVVSGDSMKKRSHNGSSVITGKGFAVAFLLS